MNDSLRQHGPEGRMLRVPNLARAELDTRRPSEANDYVRPLSSVYPDLVPTRDALTLLDTAWNPPRAGAVQK